MLVTGAQRMHVYFIATPSPLFILIAFVVIVFVFFLFCAGVITRWTRKTILALPTFCKPNKSSDFVASCSLHVFFFVRLLVLVQTTSRLKRKLKSLTNTYLAVCK